MAELNWFSVAWGWNRGYVYAGGQLLAVQQDGVVRWVHEDPITKTKRMTDSSGAPISTIVFDPWGGAMGSPWTQNASQQRRRFTTYERDGNESDEAMFRRYNRWHSRFDQTDPYDGSYNLGDPQSFNRYSYVQNDPVNFIDPLGLDIWDQNPGFIPAWMNGWDRTINPIETFINYSQDRTTGWHDFWGERPEYPWFFGGWPAFSFGPQNPAQPPFDWSLFWDLVVAAKALQRESCRNLFGSNVDPTRLLGQRGAGNAGLGAITRGDLGGVSGGTATSAQTTGILGSRTVTRPDGSTVRQSTFTGANIVLNNNAASPYQSGYGGRFGANDATNRAITLIHELGHAAGIIYGASASRILDDQNNAAQSRANSQLVYDNCFR